MWHDIPMFQGKKLRSTSMFFLILGVMDDEDDRRLLDFIG